MQVEAHGDFMRFCDLTISDDIGGQAGETLHQESFEANTVGLDACGRGSGGVHPTFLCPAGGNILIELVCHGSDGRSGSSSLQFTCPPAPSPSPTGTP